MTSLTDGDIVLRRWRADDAPAVFAACQDPFIARFTTVPHPYTEDHARDFVERAEAHWDAGERRAFAIIDSGSDAVIGSMTRFEPVGHRAEFGYWVAADARGRGVATRALRLIAEWTLETTDLIRLELVTDPENTASRRVAENAGFRFEGILRAWTVHRDGTPRDSASFAMIRDRR